MRSRLRFFMNRAVIACFMTFALGACATTTALESQSKPKDLRLARLYFIWPKSLMIRDGTLNIKVNEQSVGKIAPDSYFFVDRQPGIYTLKVEPQLDWASPFQTDVQVGVGGTYYYAINVKSAYIPVVGGGVVGVVTLTHPNPGTPMQPKGGGISFATFKLNTLDAAGAAVEMAKLDAR